jgi:ESCRT-II complex subunit VPS22
MRRSVGVGRGQDYARTQAAYKAKGNELTASNLEHATRAMKSFKESLETFAKDHRADIIKNPTFRHKFAQMCSAIGIDPLASKKGFWSELLGVGDFYYELGVQVITMSIATRDINGGLMNLDELLIKLQKVRSKGNTTASSSGSEQNKITIEDITRAIERVAILGNGLCIKEIGSKPVLVGLPVDLSKDHEQVLDIVAKNMGKCSADVLTNPPLKWDKERASRALMHCAGQGLAWYDGISKEYWFPALIPGGLLLS